MMPAAETWAGPVPTWKSWCEGRNACSCHPCHLWHSDHGHQSGCHRVLGYYSPCHKCHLCPCLVSNCFYSDRALVTSVGVCASSAVLSLSFWSFRLLKMRGLAWISPAWVSSWFTPQARFPALEGQHPAGHREPRACLHPRTRHIPPAAPECVPRFGFEIPELMGFSRESGEMGMVMSKNIWLQEKGCRNPPRISSSEKLLPQLFLSFFFFNKN